MDTNNLHNCKAFKMKKIFIYCILMITALFIKKELQAQSKIFGIIKDSLNKNIASANVLLLNALDSELVKGTLTDAQGNFLFRDIHEGNYFIRSTYTGYREYNTKSFTIAAAANKDAGVISLYQKDVQLSEVKDFVLYSLYPV